MKKLIIILAVLGLMLVACSNPARTEDESKNTIVGTWEDESSQSLMIIYWSEWADTLSNETYHETTRVLHFDAGCTGYVDKSYPYEETNFFHYIVTDSSLMRDFIEGPTRIETASYEDGKLTLPTHDKMLIGGEVLEEYFSWRTFHRIDD